MLTGLLHDIGYWILVQECPKELAQALELSQTGGLPLFECERQTAGATHAEIGAYLLGLWGLPIRSWRRSPFTTRPPPSLRTATTCSAHWRCPMHCSSPLGRMR